ncbi:MAG: hypothetical protein ABIJ53_06035 [Verrucomicrobiota bacterium]
MLGSIGTIGCFSFDYYKIMNSGENYRMSELQDAVALAQIHKADKILKGYRAAKQRIVAALVLPRGVKLQP